MLETIKQAAGVVKDLLKGKPAKARSPKWPATRKEHLKKNPTCAACGGVKKLNVHHIELFSQDPSKELLESNLITLCEDKGQNCHFVFGHLAVSWHAWNEHVRDDAALHLSRIESWRRDYQKK
jgi:hypothetical protein